MTFFRAFKSANSYKDMLTIISISTFLFLVGLITLARYRFPEFDLLLDQFSADIKVINLPIPLGTIIPSFALTIAISRMIKLHDRLSDFFGIRRRFDIEIILIPMAQKVGAKRTSQEREILLRHRSDLMRKVFYRYISVFSPERAIDEHYITMAMDQWTWFWVCIEAAFLCLLAVPIFLLAKDFIISIILIGAVLFLVLLMFLNWQQCKKWAEEEINELLRDEGRRSSVKQEFDAL